jgi:hypothetical protein
VKKGANQVTCGSPLRSADRSAAARLAFEPNRITPSACALIRRRICGVKSVALTSNGLGLRGLDAACGHVLVEAALGGAAELVILPQQGHARRFRPSSACSAFAAADQP